MSHFLHMLNLRLSHSLILFIYIFILSVYLFICIFSLFLFISYFFNKLIFCNVKTEWHLCCHPAICRILYSSFLSDSFRKTNLFLYFTQCLSCIIICFFCIGFNNTVNIALIFLQNLEFILNRFKQTYN